MELGVDCGYRTLTYCAVLYLLVIIQLYWILPTGTQNPDYYFFGYKNNRNLFGQPFSAQHNKVILKLFSYKWPAAQIMTSIINSAYSKDRWNGLLWLNSYLHFDLKPPCLSVCLVNSSLRPELEIGSDSVEKQLSCLSPIPEWVKYST